MSSRVEETHGRTFIFWPLHLPPLGNRTHGHEQRCRHCCIAQLPEGTVYSPDPLTFSDHSAERNTEWPRLAQSGFWLNQYSKELSKSNCRIQIVMFHGKLRLNDLLFCFAQFEWQPPRMSLMNDRLRLTNQSSLNVRICSSWTAGRDWNLFQNSCSCVFDLLMVANNRSVLPLKLRVNCCG